MHVICLTNGQPRLARVFKQVRSHQAGTEIVVNVVCCLDVILAESVRDMLPVVLQGATQVYMRHFATARTAVKPALTAELLQTYAAWQK